MKKLKSKDLKNESNEKLWEMHDNLKRELLALRFRASTGQLKNPSDISKIKKDIARILTVINEKNK